MIVVENKFFILKIGEDGIAKSLILRSTGEECIAPDNEIALFSITQERPYNNEIKLMYPNKRTTFAANRLRRDGSRLIVGFELVAFEAVVELEEKDNYVAFTLVDFIVPENTYGSFCQFISPPPILEFRLLQLPVIKRKRFGGWLNVTWDDNVAINILATSPYALIDSESRKDCYLMYADAVRSIKLIGTGAALIVSTPDKLLDCIDSIEKDYNLPRGVESRRSDEMDASTYWTCDISPSNVEKHIEYAKKGGFRRMLIYYKALFREDDHYSYNGDYDLNENYPNGIEDVKSVLQKIKEHGIVPGIHFLHSHIGVKSRYVTPVADHRLNLTRHFTLAKSLGTEEDVIYVEQNPEGAPLNPNLQVLKFGGEVIYYDSYTTEYPYCFNNCKRGHYDTKVSCHNMGTIGGVLDVSEFSATSVYIDETTSLQDEIAEKIACVYNAGFEFVYFDGSEGTNSPFEFNVPYAQYKVYKRFNKKPLFCAGAAKAHFGWHMLSGGNAFDVFPANVFKEKIAEFPLSVAPKMANDFTCVNFGWWDFGRDTQPDMYEYGTSKAAAYNCPATILAEIRTISECSRKDDVLEVMYRWEDVRRKKWLTQQQKELLKNPDKEYILLVNEEGEYELVPYFRIKNAAKGNGLFSAYYFERAGKTYVVCWHTKAHGELMLPFNSDNFSYEEQLGGLPIKVEKTAEGIMIPVSCRRYFSAAVSKEKLIEVFENATFIE